MTFSSDASEKSLEEMCNKLTLEVNPPAENHVQETEEKEDFHDFGPSSSTCTTGQVTESSEIHRYLAEPHNPDLKVWSFC